MTTRDHDQRPRDGQGRWVKGVDSVERDAEALRLRSRNRTLRQIADELGYGNESNVRRALQHATGRIEKPAVDHYRQVMDAQLDALEQRAQAVLDARHLVFHQGAAVTHDGAPVVDDGPVLAAVATLLRIQERRARLWGTDAPVKADVSQSGSVRYEIVGVDPEALR
jgi:hypothetical protein